MVMVTERTLITGMKVRRLENAAPPRTSVIWCLAQVAHRQRAGHHDVHGLRQDASAA
jgi:hypothetical protein